MVYVIFMSKNKIIRYIDKLEEILLVLMFIFMVLIIFVQVIMRYVFNNSLAWSEELGKFLFVWLSWVGISIGAKSGEHIKITLLIDKMPAPIAKAMNVLSELIVIGICAVTTYYGIKLVSTQASVYYAGIKISMSWGYLAVVVGCILMIIRSLIAIIDSISSNKIISGRE